MPRRATKGTNRLSHALRQFRVEDVLRVIAVVLGFVVVGAVARADLNDRQALAVDQADGELSAGDKFFGKDAFAARPNFQARAHDFLHAVADAQVHA